MTPFDATALLVMLLTFYPVVSVANLRTARAERPEYFAAGVLFGTQGEKLRLPDGRAFDLIFAVDSGPLARWQVLDVTDGGGAGSEAAYPLAPGPLVPLDLAAWPTRPRDDAFGPLVAAALSALGDEEASLGLAALAIGTVANDGALEAAWDATLGDAGDVLHDLDVTLDGAEPTDPVTSTKYQRDSIPAKITKLDIAFPHYLPAVPIPPGEPGQGLPGEDVPTVDTQGGAAGAEPGANRNT